MTINKYIIVSFYTKNTPYEIEVLNLKNSCEKFNLVYDIEGIDSLGSWRKNNNYKPRHIYKKWLEHKIPIVWIDADGIVKGDPILFNEITDDFAIHVAKYNGVNTFNASVIYFNQTEVAETYLKKWIEISEADLTESEQTHLQNLWNEMTNTYGLKTRWLPQNYNRIFDWWGEIETIDPIVIEQYQASRRFKKIVDQICDQ